MPGELERCVCCQGSQLLRVLTLGDQPPCNAFSSAGETVPTFPLELNLCESCLHLQLRFTVPADILFANYPYRTGISNTLVSHFNQLARDLCESNQIMRVLDVGCNDGTLLSAFKQYGCETWGIDPCDIANKFRVDWFVRGFCDVATVEQSALAHVRFQAITATNVLAHTAHPLEMLIACERLLEFDGVIVIESPWALSMLANNQFDTVYFEHVSYFTVTSMSRLAERANLIVDRVLETPIHGGSVRVFLKRKRDRSQHCQAAQHMMAEEAHQIQGGATNAQRRANETCERLNGLVAAQRARGRRMVGFGASGKSSVVLNACGIDLDFIIDQTPEKIGKVSPGRHIPIRDLFSMPTDDMPIDHVIFAWNCLAECVAKINLARPLGRSDGIITYVPEVKWQSLTAATAQATTP